ncbi:sialin-like isoform X2 [Photinus pyralis]|nr:sialin-like isoform X2 [Photinus pyralis]
MIWKRRRYILAVLAFFGFFNIYALRANLSIAIVDMTAQKESVLENGTIIHVRDFDWDSKKQGFVLSSFFYGYILTQMIGGWLASKFGGKHIFGLGIASTAALTVITPFVAKQSFYFLLAVRIAEGICEGVTYPCIHDVWSKWAPPLERSRMATIGFSGSFFGTVVSMPVCALLADVWGWESIFYVTGSVGLLWFLCWWLLIADSPANDKYISQSELRYIQGSLGQQVNRKVKHPWKSIATSLPVWAIVVGHFSENWGFYTLLTQLPTFMKDILHFELGSTGVMAAIPYLAISITVQLAGQLADWLRERNVFTTTQVRKIFNCGAYISQTAFMLAAAYLLSPVGTTICLTFAVGLGGFAWAGFGVNHLDIAPQHASILMGISNTFATIPGIISPVITGYIVTTPSEYEWQIVFFISSGVYLFGCIFYGVFAKGEVQSWAKESETLKSEYEFKKREGMENAAYSSD